MSLMPCPKIVIKTKFHYPLKCLLVDLVAAETNCEVVVTGKTHKDQAWMWRRWEAYAYSIGIEGDTFPDSLSNY
eukprot:13991596-Ditylum_brightwellii.AAC.1